GPGPRRHSHTSASTASRWPTTTRLEETVALSKRPRPPLVGDRKRTPQLSFFDSSIRQTPADGEKTIVWPSSQRTRRRGGSSAITSSTTPLRGGCATRSVSTTIRSPACALIAPPPRRRL